MADETSNPNAVAYLPSVDTVKDKLSSPVLCLFVINPISSTSSLQHGPRAGARNELPNHWASWTKNNAGFISYIIPSKFPTFRGTVPTWGPYVQKVEWYAVAK